MRYRKTTGKPEEWPIFISTFERSTNCCGFSLEENLVRLQRCLKGKDCKAVSSRFLLPSAVPQVIETLECTARIASELLQWKSKFGSKHR